MHFKEKIKTRNSNKQGKITKEIKISYSKE